MAKLIIFTLLLSVFTYPHAAELRVDKPHPSRTRSVRPGEALPRPIKDQLSEKAERDSKINRWWQFTALATALLSTGVTVDRVIS